MWLGGLVLSVGWKVLYSVDMSVIIVRVVCVSLLFVSNLQLLCIGGVAVYVIVSVAFCLWLLVGAVVGFGFCWFFKDWFGGWEKERKIRSLGKKKDEVSRLEKELYGR